MYRIGLAVIVLVAVTGGRAEAEALDLCDLYRKAEALAQSVLGTPARDHEIVKPSGNADPKMALAPPAGGAMRLIEPSQPFRQR